jgi:hypothetical protein
MRNWLIAAALVLSTSVSAQLMLMGVENGQGGGGPGPYQGPGDLATGWVVWGGVRAFSAATKGTPALKACDNQGTPVCNDFSTDATTGDLVQNLAGGMNDCSTVTCTVQTVYDQSGALKCTGSTPCPWTQATANLRPQLGHNCIGTNNKWCLNFPGLQPAQMMGTAAFAVGVFQPLSVSTILKYTPTGGQQEAIADTTSNLQVYHAAAASTWGFYFQGATQTFAGVTDANFYAVQLQFADATAGSFAILNGSSNTITGVGGGGLVLLNIGGSFSLPCTCMIGEIGAFSPNFTGPQVTSITSNQRTWGGF